MGHIGDVLLLTPALRMLSEIFPCAAISALVRSGTEAMLQNLPCLETIYASGEITSNQKMHVRTRSSFSQRLRQLPRGLALAWTLRRKKFDLVVDFSGTDRSSLFALISGAPRRVGYVEERRGILRRNWRYTHVYQRADAGTHKVWRDVLLLRQFLQSAGLGKIEEARLIPGPSVLNVPESDIAEVQNCWPRASASKTVRVLVHATSRVRYKCWPAENWAALIRRLRDDLAVNVLITCGPDPVEIAMARSIREKCGTENIASRLGDLELMQLAALIKSADLFLGADSAPMHIACAVGTPVVAVFGPSDDKIWGPWGENHVVVRRPCLCLESGKRHCTEEKGMDCLNALTIDEVYLAAKRALQQLQ
jgi:heptosyltransferase-3